MKQLSFFLSWATLAWSVALAQGAELGASAAEEKAVRATADKFTAAFNAGKADDVAALWAEDGEYVVGEMPVRGRAAIAKLYEEFFRANSGATMEVKIDSVRLLAPTVALEQGTAAVKNPTGGATSSAYTAIHVKQDGKWQMSNVRESESSGATSSNLNDLDWLVGKWSAVGAAGKVDISCQWFANKHFLRCESNIQGDGDAPAVATQIIGLDPLSGHIVSWFFDTEGGHGYGTWFKNGPRWLIQSVGATADGAPTKAVNVLYHPDANVASWRSVERTRGDVSLPDAKEIVIERASASK